MLGEYPLEDRVVRGGRAVRRDRVAWSAKMSLLCTLN